MVPDSLPASKREALIDLKGVTIRYGKNDVITRANLTVYKNETKVILGPSGVGKSTILKAILGLLKPAEGSIFFHNQEITHLSEKEFAAVRQKMAMVFQNGALFDSMSVGHNVSYRLRELRMLPPLKIKARVEEVLQFVGLRGAVDLRPAQLSGGMKKRVAIARALAPDPEIFLFDEPTVGLDPVNHYNVEQLILKLRHRPNTTNIIVTHDIASASRLADSIVMLHGGQFIFEGTPDEIHKSPDRRIRAFLNPSEIANIQI